MLNIRRRRSEAGCPIAQVLLGSWGDAATDRYVLREYKGDKWAVEWDGMKKKKALWKEWNAN